MATAKKSTVSEGTFDPGKIKIKKMIVSIVGDTDLVLCAKSRSFAREQMFIQSMPPGTKVPDELSDRLNHNMWEKLITSIHWLHPIEFHDDDYSKYSEEEWTNYMETNSPCILGKAFKDSLKEAFISCGFKDATGKNGTDFTRTVSFDTLNPIVFAKAGFDRHLAATNDMKHTNVLTEQNVFYGWKCDVRLEYLETAFPQKTLIQMFNFAGKLIGIGARRGEGYGRYRVEKTETFA